MLLTFCRRVIDDLALLETFEQPKACVKQACCNNRDNQIGQRHCGCRRWVSRDGRPWESACTVRWGVIEACVQLAQPQRVLLAALTRAVRAAEVAGGGWATLAALKA